MVDNPALKDIYFQPPFFEALCAALADAYPAFDAAAFMARVHTAEWGDLALKAKMRHTTEALGAALPTDYRTALGILRQTAAALNVGDFGLTIFPDFVEVYGLDDWAASIPALEQFTQVMSAEFAIRPFIIRDQARALAQMLAWTGHDSVHVRRLASEGCRPRLPWAMALPTLKKDPTPIIPILDRLKTDPEETVRRSVANNLNDIAKDNPGVVVDVLRGWQDGAGDAVQWITRHALRSLLKQGHPGALDLLGYPADPAIRVRDLVITPQSIPLGDTVAFTFEVQSSGDAPQQLMIDYVLYLMRKNGKQTAKVFKLATRTIHPGETLTLNGKQSFRPINTRTYYPGAHGIAVQINGAEYARAEFEVTA